MKNFEIKCTYTQQHDTAKAFIKQVIELVLHLDRHKWIATEGWPATEYTDADGDLCINLQFTFKRPGRKYDGKEIGNFIALCAEICGDSVRVYDGGSGPNLRYKHYNQEMYLKWRTKYFPNGRSAADRAEARMKARIKKEKLNELNKS